MKFSLRRVGILPVFAALLATGPVPASVLAQMPDTATMQAEQREAMEAFDYMDGEWRGTVTSSGPMGDVALIQTERVGTMAGGVVRLIEGRGFEEDGTLAFNAVAMITYDPANDEYVMTSTAQGFASRPWFEVTTNGFKWGFQTGPVTFEYVAVIDGDTWVEEGFMQFGDQPKQKFLEMNLERIGDTAWPGEGAFEAPPGEG